MTSDPTVELSAALDEIYRLRRALAYEADLIRQHLNYRTFPKSRRDIAERQIERMKQSARGDSESAYRDTSNDSLRVSMLLAGAGQTLTRSQFVDECANRIRLED